MGEKNSTVQLVFLDPKIQHYLFWQHQYSAKIYANEGAAQFIFLKGNEKPNITYADRNGKYMKQSGVTLPKI